MENNFSKEYTDFLGKIPLRVEWRRIRMDKIVKPSSGPVVYWMSRDQRSQNNWALLFAQDLALELKQPLVVAFCILPDYLGASMSHYRFMLAGLQELDKSLLKYNIPFKVLRGKPEDEITSYCRTIKAGALISDFSPLRINAQWKTKLAKTINLAHYEVDAHNIVPCWIASNKQEYAAYTFRPKIRNLLPEFLTDFPELIKHPFSLNRQDTNNFAQALMDVRAGELKEVDYEYSAGEKAAFKIMRNFIENKLQYYERDRNNPTLDGQSNLSPYLHFGQLSAQKLALLVQKAEAPGIHSEAFLEELIIRRELSDNFCNYQPKYDSIECFPRWASASLEEHLADRREYLYSEEAFENARTHDDLCNAAQKEMILRGKMHGYLRMYWAKKILEWTETPSEAMQIAIYLNDKYSLDGRDPNGYAGIAWSIGGVHDRAWYQRPIFGKVRYMSYKGSQTKFNVQSYIEKIAALEKR